MTYIYYNPLADGGRGRVNALRLKDILRGDVLDFQDITEIDDIGKILFGMEPDDKIVIAGGEGTLNRFINALTGVENVNNIFFYCTGKGSNGENREIISITKYLKNLPLVYVDDNSVRFISNVSCGMIDSVRMAMDSRSLSRRKRIRYRAKAIRGLMRYRPSDAVVTVDGVKCQYRRVWFAPTVYANEINDAQPDGVTTLVFHGRRLKTLAVLPSIMRGKGERFMEEVDVLTGREITVSFDKPTPIRVDGEIFNDTAGYSVRV